LKPPTRRFHFYKALIFKRREPNFPLAVSFALVKKEGGRIGTRNAAAGCVSSEEFIVRGFQ
jgi:hypothetical protein